MIYWMLLGIGLVAGVLAGMFGIGGEVAAVSGLRDLTRPAGGFGIERRKPCGVRWKLESGPGWC